jgi:tetratricopeptide (TPR) repeat protein
MKGLLKLLALCTLLTLSSLAEASNKASQMHYLKALLLANQGNSEGALKEYQQALELDPQSSFLYQQAAELALESGRMDQAREFADRFLKLEPNSPDARLLSGNVAWAQGDLRAAQASFEGVLELKPKVSTGTAAAGEKGDAYRQALFALANLFSAESPEKAKKYFEQYLTDNPENASEAESQIALIEQRAGRLDGAAEHLRSALRYNPDNSQARFALAQIYEMKRDTEAALGVYLELLQGDTRNIALLDHVGEIYYLQGDAARAKEHFQRAKAALPDHPATCLWLALMAEGEGDFAAAAKALGDSSALKDDAAVNLRLSYYLTQGGQLKDAVTVLEKAHARWGDNEEIAYFLALGYDDQKQAAKAVELMRKVVAASPDHRDARFQLGAIYDRAGKMPEAEEQFRELLKRNPQDAPALNYLGYSLADRGLKLDEAEAMVRRAVELDPKNGAYRDSLGWVCFKQGRFAEALPELNAAVKLLPEDDTIWGHLGEAYTVVGDTYAAWLAWKTAAAAAPGKGELVKKADKVQGLLVPEEIGELYLNLFQRERGAILSMGAPVLIEGQLGGKTLKFQGLFRFKSPNELSVEVLGPLFVPIFRAVLTGADGFEMDLPRIEGLSPEVVRETFYAALLMLREYLTGKAFAQPSALYRKSWRSVWIETPGGVFTPDDTKTRLLSYQPAPTGLKLVFDRYQRFEGRWVPTVLRFEGKGFAFEFRLSDPSIRFRDR